MTAVANTSSYYTLLSQPRFVAPFVKLLPGADTGVWATTFLQSPNPGSTPTTAAACTANTTGALMPIHDAAQMFLAQMEATGNGSNTSSMILVDRLSHQGGLNGTITGFQTTNLPTAALPRYISGIGVWPMIEIYSTIGTNNVTLTMSYTNQNGTSGRTTDAMAFAGTNLSVAPSALFPSLQPGDNGVKSVESVTVSGTTGAAGNFGVTLIKPLAMLYEAAIEPNGPNAMQAMWLGLEGGKIVEVLDNAHLMLIHQSTGNLLLSQSVAFNPTIIRP